MNSVAPVFMFGYERSGTTLLSMMVGAHPQIAVPFNVTGIWYRFGDRLAEYGGLQHQLDLERLVDDLLQEERIKLWDETIQRSEILTDLEPGSFAAVIAKFYSVYAEKKGKPYWGNIDIATLDLMDVANSWFPNARFIHIVRDGRDVALSQMTMPYRTSNVWVNAVEWVKRIETNIKMGAIVGSDRYLLVRYEELILDSTVTLKAICNFIQVDYHADMLRYPEMVDKKIPKDKRWLWPALDRPPDRSKVNGWKKNMAETKRLVFESEANELLKRLGYEAYGSVPKQLSAYLYELWCFLGRGNRFERLMSKFGIKRMSQLERAWARDKKTMDDGYSSVQKSAFGTLIKEGAYRDFEHSESARRFFTEVMANVLAQVKTDDALSILDCGCGPGAWLEVILDLIDQASQQQGLSLFGFDITEEMVTTAQKRFAGRVDSDHFKQGDLLKEDSYCFDGAQPLHHILYTYDVVQQLPRKFQFNACQMMLKQLAPGGALIIFDHDAHSTYGRSMGFKKFVTQYFRIELVPRHYCNAHYPKLTHFKKQIEQLDHYQTEMVVAADGKKYALVVKRPI